MSGEAPRSNAGRIFSVQQIKNWLSDKRTFGVPLAVFALCWPVLTGLSGQIPNGAYLPISIHLYDFLGSAALGAGLLTARLTLRLTNYRFHNPISSLVVLAIITSVAAVFQFSITSLIGPTSSLFAKAVPITAAASLGQLLAFMLVIRSTQDLQESTRNASSVRQKLIFLKSNLDQQLATNRQMVLEKVQLEILPTLRRLKEQLSREVENQSIAASLRQAIDKEVRPVSLALLEDKSDLAQLIEDPQLEETKGSKFHSFTQIMTQKVPLANLFALPLFALATVVFVLAGYWAIYGVGSFQAVAALSITWILWFLAGRLVGKLELRFVWHIPLALLAAVCAALVFLEVQLLTGQSASLEYAVLQSLNVGVISLLSALFSAVQGVRWAKLAIVAEDNLALELLLARLRQDLWLNRKRLAKLIHGSTQARLQVASLLLQKPEASADDRVEAAKSIEEIAKEFFDPSFPAIQLRESFSDLQTLWKGVCDVSIEVDQSLLALIESDLSASSSLDEFVREAVTNAVKHSKATTVEVKIDRQNQGSLSVSVRNSLPPAGVRLPPARSGIGSQTYDAVTRNWSLSTAVNHVILQGEIPFMPKSEA